ncbi:MAG: dihydrodipicolinate synthase family protein [Candidatus Omnitrophota bacterium]|jgi:dihydrodipicolinate synthase/N-acetylneuraminate lyase|nr:MAG: dihydrodipicolinate synthase family protein [Candidatus Omnitrophota bacterium]
MKFRGIFPAMLTPFTQDGLQLRLDLIAPLGDYLLESGAHGLFICGTTSEGPLLTADEKIAVMKTTAKAINGRCPIIGHIGCGEFPETLKLARQARDLGVDALSILQPWFFYYDDEAQYAYLSKIAEAAGDFPLFLYNLPFFTHNPLNPATVERLLKNHDNICGIKESGDFNGLQQWTPFRSERFRVVCGTDPDVYDYFTKLDGVMVVSSISNVLTRVFRRLFDAVGSGDLKTAQAQQEQINRLIKLILGPNLMVKLKEILRFRGVDAGYVRPPLRSLTTQELDELKNGAKEIHVLD